ncbi:hypothetical protein MLD38_003532 [Melastoma candidum]|uniref:Uncharacterized protein n=1 Tax=Melastoma candidum TaxID=119954 RepID=A0ACB9S244_9MYRT|nr:hypothetical protein MLD38_003532 [Melastoma candidum]
MNSLFGHHHHQEMSSRAATTEKKPRPQPDESLKCPRCDSTNTKFCYYNNYSLSQPRYFCKTCRRYWTKGGTLRNVPVGGGCRRSRRSVQVASSLSSRIRTHDNEPISPFASVAYESPDLAPFMQKLVSGHEAYYDLPYPTGPHDRGLPSSVGILDAIKGGLGLLQGRQQRTDTSGMYDGVGARTTDIADAGEGVYEEDRVLVGFPWQVNGEASWVNLVDVMNPGRGAWNYGNGMISGSSSWYNGLVDSPLM